MINYYDQIKEKLIDNEIYVKVKDYSKERHRVITYYEIGRLLNEAGTKYGENIIEEYSKKLTIEVGNKYNRRTLFRMKQFYNVFKNEKVSTMWTQLSWSQLRLLFNLDVNEINYYIRITNTNVLTVRELETKIKLKEHKRLDCNIIDINYDKNSFNIYNSIKNPIIINTSSNKRIYSEKILQQVIVDNIKSFMNELGEGYSFIGNEYKIKIGNSYNYIDLLLFNYKFNCFVVIELKIVELKKEHIGQIEVYMNYIDKNIKEVYHDKTIGIIICKKNNKYIIEYSSDKRIISREYKLI